MEYRTSLDHEERSRHTISLHHSYRSYDYQSRYGSSQTERHPRSDYEHGHGRNRSHLHASHDGRSRHQSQKKAAPQKRSVHHADNYRNSRSPPPKRSRLEYTTHHLGNSRDTMLHGKLNDRHSGQHYQKKSVPKKRAIQHADNYRNSCSPPPKRPRLEHDKSKKKRPAVVEHVTSNLEAQVTFPELWGTYVTEVDERQMEQWQQEAEEMQAGTPGSARGQTAADGSRASSQHQNKGPQPEQPRPANVMYINKKHAFFSQLF